MSPRISTAAVVAVAASLVAGLGACSSTSKAAGDGPGAAGTSAASTATSQPSATASTTASADPAADSSTAANSTGSATGFTDAQLETMRSKVAAAFGQGVTPGGEYSRPKTVNTAELAADFDSPATMKALWGSGSVGADRPMDCGMAKYDGVAIGAVRTSGGAASIPVMLYEAAKAGSAAITVNVDPASGVIKGATCGGAPSAADFPGLAAVSGYYGALVSMDPSVVSGTSGIAKHFTPAFNAYHPTGANYEVATCSQDVPGDWTVALTGTNSSSSTWDYSPAAVNTIVTSELKGITPGFSSALAVDLGSDKISRVTCDQAKPPVAGGTTKPADYAQQLLDYYRLAADQKSLGVDAKAAIRPFFVSDAAFAKAWGDTGTVPLLCAKQVPGSVAVADGTSPTTSGTQTTVHMVTWQSWHPDAPGQEASKFTAVFDTQTMKIASITCA